LLAKLLRVDASTTCKAKKKYLSNPLLYKLVTSGLWKGEPERSLWMAADATLSLEIGTFYNARTDGVGPARYSVCAADAATAG